MTRQHAENSVPRPQQLAEQAFETVRRFLHIEAASGICLLAAAAAALIWANSPFGGTYEAFWHLPVSVGFAGFEFRQSLHFWINDVLMAVFFLVVGMEIRREIHEGALSRWQEALLPLGAALGGVACPALIYLAINPEAPRAAGWGIPTATDIAFAVGVLALLGRSVPGNVRIVLLALAIIDDIIAVLIIAVFYSGGLRLDGFLVAASGVFLVLGLQRIGVGSAFAYAIPGLVVWTGFLMSGAHPTLAGVVLGLLTPVRPIPMARPAADVLVHTATSLAAKAKEPEEDSQAMVRSLDHLRHAGRELLPPVVRVQAALHPWVAFAIMPLFALANAGVNVQGVDFRAGATPLIVLGVAGALVVGKPLGIVAAVWIMLRLRWCRLPSGVNWRSIWLIGLLAGIGFTMSIFIAMLAFGDEALLAAAKLGVLLGSLAAALLGLAWGVLFRSRAVRA